MGGAGEIKAVCLLSGGIDSSVATGIAKAAGYEIYALTFRYNQRHIRELESATKLARFFGVEEHKILDLDLGKIGGSALTSPIEVPEGKTVERIKSGGIPVTYVPARNTIFLSYGLAYAEVINANFIFIGANYVDCPGYPDCRPEYFGKFQEMANLATKRAVEGSPVKIKYPLIAMSKAEIIKKGHELGVPFELTWSCYKGGEKACGKCDSCILRLKGFEEAGYEDPLVYDK